MGTQWSFHTSYTFPTDQPVAKNSHTLRDSLSAIGQIQRLELGYIIMIIYSSCVYYKQKLITTLPDKDLA